MNKLLLANFVTVSLIFSATHLFADDPLVNFTSSDVNPAFNISFSNSLGGFDLGYKFTVNSPLTVTELGIYDDFGDGLISSHQVGLYSSDGTLLSTATVNPSDPLTGLFRYASIVPVTLPVGDYVLVGVAGYDPGNPVDNYTHDPSNITYNSNITFDGNRVISGVGNSLMFLSDANTEVSTDPPLDNGWFGPNLLASVPVPEPATMLTLIGMGAIVLKSKLRKDKAEA